MRCNTCNANQPEIKGGNCIYCRFRANQKENEELRELLREAVNQIEGYAGFDGIENHFTDRPEVKALLEKDK